MKNEAQLIGGMLNKDKKFVIKLLKIIRKDNFEKYGNEFQIVADAILKDENPTDVLIEKNGLSNFVFNEFLPDYQIIKKAEEIKKISTVSRVKRIFSTYVNKICDINLSETISEFQKKIFDVIKEIRTENNDIKDIIFEYNEEQAKHINKDGIIGISTGFNSLDRVIDGLREEHFWVVGGNTSSGKTFFALNMLVAVLRQNKRCAFYSLEMGKVDLVSRILGIMTEMNGSVIFKAKTTPENLEKADTAKEELYHKKLTIYSEIRDIDDLIISITEEKLVNNANIIFIDYLQLISSRKESKEYDVLRKVATDLQDLAKNLKICIVCLSQLSNDAIRNPNSEVMGFKGAGNIAASADMALEIKPVDKKEVRDEKLAKGEEIDVKLIIKKNRHGRVGWSNVKFNGSTGLFVE
jgi:replicative DNA helicase